MFLWADLLLNYACHQWVFSISEAELMSPSLSVHALGYLGKNICLQSWKCMCGCLNLPHLFPMNTHGIRMLGPHFIMVLAFVKLEVHRSEREDQTNSAPDPSKHGSRLMLTCIPKSRKPHDGIWNSVSTFNMTDFC